MELEKLDDLQEENTYLGEYNSFKRSNKSQIDPKGFADIEESLDKLRKKSNSDLTFLRPWSPHLFQPDQ